MVFALSFVVGTGGSLDLFGTTSERNERSFTVSVRNKRAVNALGSVYAQSICFMLLVPT